MELRATCQGAQPSCSKEDLGFGHRASWLSAREGSWSEPRADAGRAPPYKQPALIFGCGLPTWGVQSWQKGGRSDGLVAVTGGQLSLLGFGLVVLAK